MLVAKGSPREWRIEGRPAPRRRSSGAGRGGQLTDAGGSARSPGTGCPAGTVRKSGRGEWLSASHSDLSVAVIRMA